GPVRQPVDGATIAQHDGRVFGVAHDLQLPLHVVDRALGRPAKREALAPWKAAPEHDAGALGKDRDVATEILPHELQDRRLAGSRSTREDDSLRLVLRAARTRRHA